MPDTDLRLDAALTCPGCGATTRTTMPEDVCQFFWDCPTCGAVVRPKRADDGSTGDCCVFCSYADTPCPPVQRGRACC